MTQLVYDRQDSFAGGMWDAEGNALPPNACEVLLNFETTRAGKVRRRKANVTQGVDITSQDVAPQRGLSYEASGGIQWVLVGFTSLVDFAYSDDDGATWTENTGLAAPAAHASILNIGGTATLYLTVPTGGAGTSLYSWDGTTATAIATAPTASNLIASFNDRLWVVPVGSDQVYASQVAAAGWDTDAGAFTVSVTPDDDDTDICALLPLGNELLVFRRRSVSSIRGYGEQSLIVAEGAKGVSRLVGAIDGDTICRIDGERAMWLSERGVEIYEGGAVRRISTPLERLFENGGWDQFGSFQPSAGYDPVQQIYRLSVPITTSTFFEWIFNVRDGSQYIHAPTGDSTITSANFALGTDGTIDLGAYIVTGSAARIPQGYFLAKPADETQPYLCFWKGGPLVRVGASTATTENTVTNDAGNNSRPLFGWLRSRPFVFGNPSRRKRVREIRVDVGGTGSGTITVRPVVDGVAGSTIDLTIADPGDSRKPRTYKARVTGTGRTIQVDLWTQGDFTINGIEVGAQILSQGAS